MQSLGAVFTTDPVASFPFPKATVVEIDAKTKVNEAFKVLIANNLLSAPVYDHAKREYLGFFEVQDAIGFATKFESLFLGHDDERTLHEVGTMLAQQKETHKHGPWVPVPPTTPMAEVIRLLTKVRRVPVIDPKTGRVSMVISQSLICQQVSEALAKMSEIPAKFLQTAAECGVSIKAVVTVSEDTLARDAFQMLIDRNVSALGITDEDGGLLTCLTAKDIRLLPIVDKDENASAEDTTTQELLGLPVVDFVSKARLVSEKKGKARPAVSVTHMDTQVHHMIAKLAKTNMHRLFLVDGEHKPKGVFSVADVVKILVD